MVYKNKDPEFLRQKSRESYLRNHKRIMIEKWEKVHNVKLRDNESWDDLYNKWDEASNCNVCKIELVRGNSRNGKCLDHDHETGYYRQILCRGCNVGYDISCHKDNRLGIKYITQTNTGSYMFQKTIKGVRYQKTLKTLEEAIQYRDNFDFSPNSKN